MDVSGFKTLFGESVRTWMDWDAVGEDNASVEDRVITAREDVGELWTVWHVDPEGNPGEWSEPQNKPLQVSEAAVHDWPEDRRAKIERMREQFTDEKDEPVVMALPAYRAGDEFIVLDSNHRLIAAYLAEVPLRILAVILDGPLSARVLPGLRHFQDQDPHAGRGN